jgi:hypothetical protein
LPALHTTGSADRLARARTTMDGSTGRSVGHINVGPPSLTPRVDVHPTSIASMYANTSVTQPINDDNVSRETRHQLEPALSGGSGSADDRNTNESRPATSTVPGTRGSSHGHSRGAAPRRRCSRSHHDRLEHLLAASELAAASTDHLHLPVIQIAHGLDDPHARPVDVPQSRTHSGPSLRPVSPNREHRAPRSAPLVTTSAHAPGWPAEDGHSSNLRLAVPFLQSDCLGWIRYRWIVDISWSATPAPHNWHRSRH